MKEAALSVVALLLASCEAAFLSDEEAIRLIRESQGYPKLVSVDFRVKQNSPLGREIARLEKEGFLTCGTVFSRMKSTEKSKGLVNDCRWNGIYREWQFSPYTHRRDVTKIVDKRIDKEQGAAQVVYEVVATPTAYFNELRKLDPQQVDETLSRSPRNTSPAQEKATFQKWEKGWRIASRQ